MNGMYGYGNGYGYAPPYTPQMGTGAQMPQRCQVIKVNGRNGADAFRMAADSSVLLLDENDPIVWLKTTDGAGYPTITPYSIAPYQPAPLLSPRPRWPRSPSRPHGEDQHTTSAHAYAAWVFLFRLSSFAHAEASRRSSSSTRDEVHLVYKLCIFCTSLFSLIPLDIRRK